MGSTTPLHALPYPASGDAFNVPVDVENLANAVDNTLPYYGTTAPSSPAVGQLWWNSSTMQAQLWNGTAWIPAQAAPPAARVTITGAHTLTTSGQWTQILGGASIFTVDYDPYSLWSTSSSVFFLMSYPGLWRARGRLVFPANGTGARGVGFAWSSAGLDSNRQVTVAGSNVITALEANTEGQVSGSNQYVRLMGVQSSGGSMTLIANGEFSVEWIGPLA